MVKLAEIRIRPEPYYRRQAVETGLRRLGYYLGNTGVPKGPDDLLVLWGRKRGRDDDDATLWEQRGGKVLVLENGYLQRVDKTMYAVSLSQHHTGGPVGAEDRFSLLGFEPQPWQHVEAGHMLVCGQRGIGSPVMASPPQWAEKMAKTLEKRWPTKVRLHPGNHAPKVPIEQDLAGARACVVWSSNAGVRALVAGYPVVYHSPHWICAEGACRGVNVLGFGDASRAAALQRMAHSQWSVAEIESGEPFARLLGVAC